MDPTTPQPPQEPNPPLPPAPVPAEIDGGQVATALPPTTPDSPVAAQPPIQPPSMPASAMPGMVSPKPRRRGMLMALIVAGAIVLLGGSAAAAYFGYYVPNKPENILRAALANSFSPKNTSAYFEGSVTATSTQDNQTFTANLTGKANTNGAFELDADVDAVVTKLTLDVRSVDGTSLYLKVGGLDGLPELLKAASDDPSIADLYGPLITSLNEQWLEINQSLLKQAGVNLNQKLSDADRQKLADVYTNNQFLTLSKTLPSETIKGMDSYHYQVTIDKTGLKNFFQGLKDANISSLKLTQDQVNTIKKGLDQDHTDLSKFPLDVWVSKKFKLIDQLSLTMSDDTAKVNFKFTVFNYNQPVVVEKPAGAKSILDVLGKYFGPLTNMLNSSSDGGSTTTTPDSILNDLQNSGISL